MPHPWRMVWKWKGYYGIWLGPCTLLSHFRILGLITRQCDDDGVPVWSWWRDAAITMTRWVRWWWCDSRMKRYYNDNYTLSWWNLTQRETLQLQATYSCWIIETANLKKNKPNTSQIYLLFWISLLYYIIYFYQGELTDTTKR